MTEIVKLGEGKFDSVLEKAARVLKKGGVAIYPTETAYGIGCRISAEKAVKRVYEIKGRDLQKALPIIASSREMISEFAVIDETAAVLIEKFMPGPLTLVVGKKKSVPDIVSRENIAFRIPANEFARKLCGEVGEPIVSTSANIEGEGEIYSAERVIEKFSDLVDLIINAGELEGKEVSTIFDVENKKVLRQGPVSEGEINSALAEN